jgi:t-SNARE complex subunit (syntaxin)
MLFPALPTGALSNVKYRHNEIQDIKAEFIELAELFQEAGELVDKQDELIKAIELNNEQAAKQLEKGNTEVKNAIKHTRFRNNKKWWALLIAGM